MPLCWNAVPFRWDAELLCWISISFEYIFCPWFYLSRQNCLYANAFAEKKKDFPRHGKNGTERIIDFYFFLLDMVYLWSDNFVVPSLWTLIGRPVIQHRKNSAKKKKKHGIIRRSLGHSRPFFSQFCENSNSLDRIGSTAFPHSEISRFKWFTSVSIQLQQF